MESKKGRKQKNLTLASALKQYAETKAKLESVKQLIKQLRQQEFQKIMQTTFATDEELDDFLITIKNNGYSLYNIGEVEEEEQETEPNNNEVGAEYDKKEEMYQTNEN